MKVKVANGNLLYKGAFYPKGKCLEIADGEYNALQKFVKLCDCGCSESNDATTTEIAITKKKRKKKKDCKTC